MHFGQIFVQNNNLSIDFQSFYAIKNKLNLIKLWTKVQIQNFQFEFLLRMCLCFQSSQIPYSAFESDWTGIPIEAKKNLLIFIMRSQKPIKMSAINLFSLSLSTFTTVSLEDFFTQKSRFFLQILRTSWSYFAVLRQVNAQD
jgi:hypothetical protein